MYKAKQRVNIEGICYRNSIMVMVVLQLVAHGHVLEIPFSSAVTHH